MEIEESAIGHDGLIIVLKGDLNAKSADKTRKTIASSANKGIRQVIVDLEAVPFIDSSGLVALISGARNLNAQGGILRLVAPQPQVRLLFELTMAERVLNIYPSRASALQDAS